MTSQPIDGEIRLRIDGQNEFPCLPLWKTGDGVFYLPRKGELVFQDGVPFVVTNLEWRYVGRELRYVVVLADQLEELCDAAMTNVVTGQETRCIHTKRNHPLNDGRRFHMTPTGVTWVRLND